MKNYIIILLLSICLFSCDELPGLLEDTGLSTDEIVEGLKTALEIGADSAIALTSKKDGFYKNELIKIVLPPEADIIMDNKDNELLQILQIDQMIEDVILRINRAAENAASKAKPIFIDAITDMTIVDGLDILYGTNPLDTLNETDEFDSTAATSYLIGKTYVGLYDLFKPDVDNALNADLVAGISTNDAWNTLISAYNGVIDRSTFEVLGVTKKLLDWDKVEVSLDDWVTTKALDGLFFKLKDEEKKIRQNPLQWVEDIIQKVFGYVKDNPDLEE